MSRPVRMILVVEDSEDDADLTLRAFRNSGLDCKIELVRDGRAALEYLMGPPERHVELGLVLLDLKLPCVSGLDVLREIRQRPNGLCVPVVVMSCSSEQADINASYTLGANSYIRKPVDFDHFAKTIQALGSYWLALNELPGATARAP